MSKSAMKRMSAEPYTVAAQEVLESLEAGPEGLGDEEASRRLQEYGSNRLPAPRRRSATMRFLAQFHNILIYILLITAIITAFLGHWVDSGVIAAVVIINAVIGFIQEGKAERALDAIQGMLSPQCMVVRNSRRRVMAAEALVPGDVVFLQSGDKVPADLRLFSVKELRIDEALLTGESAPVGKTGEPVRSGAPLGERFGMAYSGTLVTSGQGSGVVTATGASTELGRINAMLAEVQPLTTPLLRQMEVFGRWLSFTIVVIAGLTLIFGILVRELSLAEIFLAAVGLAVAAIPEGLPAILTITLAIGVQRMARRNAIIRRLPAVETLGSVTTICSDKTGTLTRNEMTVATVALSERMLDVTGVGYDPHGALYEGDQSLTGEDEPDLMELVSAALLCNDAELEEKEGQWTISGDPTEGALVVLAAKMGLEETRQRSEFPRTDTIPFESEHRFMATLHHDHAGHGFIYVKGAPERLLGMCARQRHEGDDVPINLEHWHQQVEDLAQRGQRVLAIAFGTARPEQKTVDFHDVETGLTLLGLVGIIDPPREEAVRSVALCQSAGIRVKMITGDHAATARAIGAQLGIGDGRSSMTGPELDALADVVLLERAQAVDVFARTSPENKLRLVQALQQAGHIVAMTGDGVNDAPALKRADVGVAMGQKGTEVSKEAAEIVLADDNFTSIVEAVKEGRTIHDNLKKSILFILPTNGGQAGAIIAAIVFGFVLPITAVQILWVNMVTAVTLALSLAFEPPEENVMQRSPRDPREPLLSRFLIWRISFVSLILVAGTVGMFQWELHRDVPLESARVAAVNTLVMGQIFYLFSVRHLTSPSYTPSGLAGNPIAVIAVGVIVLLQLLFTYAPPMEHFFGTAPIDGQAWIRILGVGMVIFVVVEFEKFVLRQNERGASSRGTLPTQSSR